MGMGKKKEPLIYKGSRGGRNRTRTCDPIDVNDVLYQLSHATRIFCLPLFLSDENKYITSYITCQHPNYNFLGFL